MEQAQPAARERAAEDAAVVVRVGTPDDAAGIARCHVLGWQLGCAGVVAQDYLSGLDLTAAEQRWTSTLGRPEHGVVVAELAGGTAGFARAGMTPDPRPGEDPAPGELRELYVDPAHWGSGVAGLLHHRAIADLIASGFGTAVLWVVAGNERAIRFYRRRGWRADGWQRTEHADGSTWQEIRMYGRLDAG